MFLAATAFAQTTLVLNPVNDNSVFSESGTSSNGAGVNIFAGKTTGINGGAVRRGLLKFDLSSLPTNAIISVANLSIAVLRSSNNTTASHSFSLHKATKSWGEGTSNGLGSGASATANDATWQYAKYTSSLWTNVGGDFVSTPTATTAASLNDYAVWTGSIVTDLNFWRTTPLQNFGWILIGDEITGGSAKGFGSKENALFKPELTITYSIPSAENIYINELNPNKKWIELFNPGPSAVDLTEYWLANGSNILQITTLNILNGNRSIETGRFTVLGWNLISSITGEIALFKGNPSLTGSELKDYIQYGTGNQANVNLAVSSSCWINASTFLPIISHDTLSYALNPTLNYSSGLSTNPSDYLIQRETPSLKNDLCSLNSILTGSIQAARYQASQQIVIDGKLNLQTVKTQAGQAINIVPPAEIKLGGVFEAKIGGCY